MSNITFPYHIVVGLDQTRYCYWISHFKVQIRFYCNEDLDNYYLHAHDKESVRERTEASAFFAPRSATTRPAEDRHHHVMIFLVQVLIVSATFYFCPQPTCRKAAQLYEPKLTVKSKEKNKLKRRPN
jgi:hypothetical protein